MFNYIKIFFFTFLISSIHLLYSEELILPKDIETRANQILQKENNRMLYEERKEQKNTFIPTYQIPIDHNGQSTEQCFTIKHIKIHDNTIIKQKEFNIIINSYQNRCLSQHNISNLLNQITNLYIKRGYITCRAYLKPQDLSSETLHIYIYEGKVDTIYYNKKESLETKTAFPNLKDKVLNLRDIEMGLEQLNRLYTNDVSLDILASNKEGYSNINIVNNKDNYYYASISLSNNNSPYTGDYIGSLDIYLEDILGLNEQISFNLNGTLKQLNEKRTIGRSIGLSIPYGYFLFSTGAKQYLYRSTILGEKRNYISSGINTTYFHKLAYTFFRNQNSTAKINLSLDIKENLNFIANELIKISSTKLTVGTIGIQYNYRNQNHRFYSEFLVKKGLPLFDSLVNTNTSFRKAQYTAYSVYLSLNKNLYLFQTNLNFSSILSGQYSPDKLYGTELFSIGGIYTVRGYNNMNYSGEIGAYIRNELTYSFTNKFFGQNIYISPFAGFDAGGVEYDPDIYKWMLGSAFGLNITHKKFSFDITVGVPLYAYDPIAEKKMTTYFNLQMQF